MSDISELGMDVAKAKLDCCLLLDNVSFKRKNKVVENSPDGIEELLIWVVKQKVVLANLRVTMEGTGVYHEPAALLLSQKNVHVSIVNPLYVKRFREALAKHTKTDKMDSYILARYGLMQSPPAWIPPSTAARTLQALLARREAILQDLQRERNRQEKADFTDTPALVKTSLTEGISFQLKQLAKLQQDIDKHIDQHPEFKNDLALMQTIPGVGPVVSSNMLAMMQGRKFNSAEQLAAYLGLVPVERQSGSSVHERPKLSKTGPSKMRAILYMSAVVAIRHNPHIKSLYDRLLARGKTKMSALGAAMRKIVHLCFGVVKNQTPYQANFAKIA